MSEQPKKRRGIPRLLSVFLVLAALIFIGVMRINSLLFRRKMIKLSDLKFPVLVVRGPGSALYATWDDDTLCNISTTSTRIPRNGMVLIDSDFTMATLENVTYNKGDFAWIGHTLFPFFGFRYKFDLRKRDDSGLPAAMKSILECGEFSEDPAEDLRIRLELARQTTMDGILTTLQFQKPQPPVPDTQPASTEPSPETIEPLPGIEK